MAQFSQVKYDDTTKTAEVGTGPVWDEVYEALEPYGVTVVGGRVTGVGVAGFTLGGGLFMTPVVISNSLESFLRDVSTSQATPGRRTSMA